MALPLVSSRPEKSIDNILSRWNAASTPLIYDLTNTKWPTNSEDTIQNITGVTDDNGFAKLAFDLSVGVNANEWIEVTFANVYNGVHRVIEVSGLDLTIDFPFSVNTIGNAQKYFQNYTTLIEVYAGLQPTHEHAATKPIELIGTIEQRPDTDNSTLADVRDYVKNKLNTIYDQSQTSWPNDLNGWTDFYISFAERYDIATAGVVSDFTSDFTDDTDVDGIIYLKAINGGLQFGATRGGNMFDHVVFDSTGAYFDGGALFMTFFERPEIIDSNNFDISIILDANGEYPNLNIIRKRVIEYDVNGVQLSETITAVPRQDYGLYRIDIGITQFAVGIDHLELTLLDTNNFVLSEVKTISIPMGVIQTGTTSVSTPIDSPLPLGSEINFDTIGLSNDSVKIDDTHVINVWSDSNSDGAVRMFLTNLDGTITSMDSIKIFESDSSTRNQVIRLDSNFIIITWRQAATADLMGRVYSYNTTTGVLTAIAAEQILHSAGPVTDNNTFTLDSTHFVSAWQGTSFDGFMRMFEVNTGTGVITGLDSELEFETDLALDISGFLIDATHFNLFWNGPSNDGFARMYSFVIATGVITGLDSALEFDAANGRQNSAFLIDSTHCINFWKGGASQTGQVRMFSFVVATGVITAQDSALEFDSTTTVGDFSGFLINSAVCGVTWKQSAAIGKTELFDFVTATGVITSKGANVTFESAANSNNSAVLMDSNYFINFWTGAEGDAQLFEITVTTIVPVFENTDSACDTIVLNWLNTLGDWEHWNFTAFKTYGDEISNVNTIKRDIFQDWDTDFIAGRTESEHLSLDANDLIVVRSQDLTVQQINAIKNIKKSIKVNDETDVSNIVTVLVDKASFQFRTDKDKRHSIEFTIRYPGQIIQSQ